MRSFPLTSKEEKRSPTRQQLRSPQRSQKEREKQTERNSTSSTYFLPTCHRSRTQDTSRFPSEIRSAAHAKKYEHTRRDKQPVDKTIEVSRLSLWQETTTVYVSVASRFIPPMLLSCTCTSPDTRRSYFHRNVTIVKANNSACSTPLDKPTNNALSPHQPRC